jgi:hypothetical protein
VNNTMEIEFPEDAYEDNNYEREDSSWDEDE